MRRRQEALRGRIDALADRLRAYLTEHSVALSTFTFADDLERHLAADS